MERDKVAHFLVCFALVTGGTIGTLYNDWLFLAGLVGASAFAIGKEMWDEQPGGSGWSWKDLYADWLGIAAGTILYAAGVLLN
jgi:uncharacterized protein YfiM (DUF2279 family)